jgi:thymidine phosphorylase
MTFFPQEVIRRKRDGQALTREEIEALVQALTDGSLSDGQAAAFAMAVYFQDMTADERLSLTQAMANSGERLTWPGLDRPVLDKHSTGGIGDKVSLILAPLLAACGAAVPMISGRGLGHTGGTLDKLESIPGYDAQPDLERFQAVVRAEHCAIIGQTGSLAPADGRLYAIRDVTATVESIPLITASILSKKLAAGLQGLVMDVKTGGGAFMPLLEDARKLARSLAETGAASGLPVTALITDMDQPLGLTAGNALEVREALDFLKGEAREPRLEQVTLALAAEALLLSDLVADQTQAARLLDDALQSGAAADRFQRMVAALGGPADLLEAPDEHLPEAPLRRPVLAGRSGVAAAVDTRAVGLAVMGLGGGRRRADQSIDPAVGFSALLPRHAAVEPDTPLALIHARDEASFEEAANALRRAYRIEEEDGAAAPSPVIERIGT